MLRHFIISSFLILGYNSFSQSLFSGEGQYFPGDFHVHSTGASNDTGGDSFPTFIKKKAQERGLYFVVLTDHSNSTGSDVSTTEEDPSLFNMGNEFPYWDSVQILSEPGKFLMVDGNEISPIVEGEVPLLPTGHIGCIPRSISSFDTSGAFIDRPRGAVNGADVLAQSNERGAFSIINHPYAPTPWINYDWTDRDNYNGMEVWNGTGGFDPFDQISYDLWRADMLQGLNICPIGGSDNHRVNLDPALTVPDLTNPALAFPTTSVLAKDGTWESIIDALDNGMVCIHEGASFLEIRSYNSIGKPTQGNDISTIRLKGKLDERAPLPYTLNFLQAFSAVDGRPYQGVALINGSNLPIALVLPGDSFDVEVPVLINRGLLSATLTPSIPLSGGRETHFVALSRGILIANATSIKENDGRLFEITKVQETGIEISLFNVSNSNTSFEIRQYNSLGKLVFSEKYNYDDFNKKVLFQAKKIGVSIIQLQTSNGEIAVRRLKY